MIEYLLTALAAAIAIDLLFGDPSNRRHPVAWLGKLIDFFVPRLKGNNEKARGIVFAILLVAGLGVAIHLAAASLLLLGSAVFVIFAALVLKIAISLRGMERHAVAIMNCLEKDDLAGARQNLSMIVRRRVDDLDRQHILSATIECVSESTVDGVTSPLFYYSVFGPAGSFAYRIINTLDSMVGYKDDYYKDIGWMSARLDSIANYIPARITAFLMVVAAKIVGADWKNSIQILHRDHGKTFSQNAGYPMATMAGALRVRLEKIGHYALGDEQEPASIAKCRSAISIMKLTALLFCLVVSVPAMSILFLAGWWRLLFGIF